MNYDFKVARRGPVQVMLHAPRGGPSAPRAPRDYFSWVTSEVGQPGKMFPGSTGGAKTLRDHVLLVHPEPPMGIPRAPESPCRVLHSIDWEGEQALLELTLVDARTVFGCHRTRGPGGRERWLILLVQVTSYPERCAEHGGPRSAFALASSVSAFFSAFFRSCAAARSTGRTVTVLKFSIICMICDSDYH